MEINKNIIKNNSEKISFVNKSNAEELSTYNKEYKANSGIDYQLPNSSVFGYILSENGSTKAICNNKSITIFDTNGNTFLKDPVVNNTSLLTILKLLISFAGGVDNISIEKIKQRIVNTGAKGL